VVPEPLDSAEKLKEYTLSDVPNVEALTKFLQEHKIDTEQWGKGNTKEVKKYWGELKGDEAGLEVWRMSTGELVPIRVTHVLRAKVSSPECYERGIYLFNTWQQYGDGRKRTRNGLLSEKLTISEMPLADNLHEVCERAVVEEEMCFVVDSAVKVQPNKPPPEHDPNYRCPLKVITEDFMEHTIEIEASKSYPGLMTMYHLYTVDIICSGLPTVDFNTLEFEHDVGKDGMRKLKYVHAWVWLRWDRIQRYLFESSEVKARKTKGSFQDAKQLATWLSQFDLGLEEWGRDGRKDPEALFKELENEETVLELWSRREGGVPLLMRVVHVIQLKLASTDSRQAGKMLFHVWQQSGDGYIKNVNRPLSRKLSTADAAGAGKATFNDEKFRMFANQAVQDQLGHLVDLHTRVGPSMPPERIQGYHPEIAVRTVNFCDHRYDLEDSPSFKGLVTMYHLYTVDVQCEGLPVTDFASVVTQRSNTTLCGWSWITWQQSIDILHARAQTNERRKKEDIQRLNNGFKAGLESLTELTLALGQLQNGSTERSSTIAEVSDLCKELEECLQSACQPVVDDRVTPIPTSISLPPTMVSDLAARKLVTDSFLDEAEVNNQRKRPTSDLSFSPSTTQCMN
jgi:hypothetical protein